VLREEKPVPIVRKLFTSLPDYFARDAEAWVHAISNPGGPFAQQLSGNTVKSYHDGMATFEKWLWDYWGGLPSYDKFTEPHARAFIEALVRMGYRPRSIGLKRSAMKTFWDYLVSSGKTTINPFTKAPVAIPISVPKRPFSEKEDLDMVPKFHLAGIWYPALLIMRFAGLRLSETLDLSPADINWSAKGRILRIRVKGRKGKERWAAMVSLGKRYDQPDFYQREVWKAVKARWIFKFLFKAGKGGLFSTYRTMIKRGLLPKGFSPQRLRDTFANCLKMGGCREATVSALLGHEDIRTRMYGAKRPEDVEGHFLREWEGLGN
jgi:site-specific recombinase XerD